jgi:hypothetical protein
MVIAVVGAGRGSTSQVAVAVETAINEAMSRMTGRGGLVAATRRRGRVGRLTMPLLRPGALIPKPTRFFVAALIPVASRSNLRPLEVEAVG